MFFQLPKVIYPECVQNIALTPFPFSQRYRREARLSRFDIRHRCSDRFHIAPQRGRCFNLPPNTLPCKPLPVLEEWKGG